MSLDAKEAGELFRFSASFVLVINIQNAFDLTQVVFWDCIYRVKSQDDFTSTVNLTVNGHSSFMCRYNLSKPKQDPAHVEDLSAHLCFLNNEVFSFSSCSFSSESPIPSSCTIS
mgnify:CR=1 FL=1